MRARARVVRVFFLLFLGRRLEGVHFTGQWNSQDEPLRVVAKFGFQKTDTLRLEHTRGFVYGNITRVVGSYSAFPQTTSESSTSKLFSDKTSPELTNGRKALMVLMDRSYFADVYEKSRNWDENPGSCQQALKQLSEAAYERRCAPHGKQDFFRWVPCPLDQLCPDEDEPANVVPGYQITYRIQNRYSAGFWYLVLIACSLNSVCNWTSLEEPVSLGYDLWLVNGNPLVKYRNPFEHQFSFDEQDTPEIYLVASVLFLALTLLQCRAMKMMKGASSRRSRGLFVLSVIETTGILFNLFHVLLYSFNGRGFLPFRWMGDFLYVFGIGCFILLLILLGRGWSISYSELRIPYWVYCIWGVSQTINFLLFVWNSQAVDAIEEIDIFETWPGWGILLLRVILMFWFVLELRRTVLLEGNEEKVKFIIHLGAGYMVWFVHLPVLGIAASYISPLWRFKVILSVSFLANFLGLAVLIHLFWPMSTNRRFFVDRDKTSQLVILPQDDLEDFEKALVDSGDPLLNQHPPDPSDADVDTETGEKLEMVNLFSDF